jgi:hypothetical protein
MPVRPEKIITATPILRPAPPNEMRYNAVITVAIMVGMGPKNNPEMLSSMERESKISLSCKFQDVSISITPISPITNPAMILKIRDLNLLFLAHK